MDYKKNVEKERAEYILHNYDEVGYIENKILKAEVAYKAYMDIVLPGWEEDPNSQETPYRVAKMHINEIFKGIYMPEPKITAFPNVDNYTGIVFQGNIDVKSICSHHHAFFYGKAYIAYIPTEKGNIIGLSKLNRIVDYYARKPQVQENLTQQILEAIDELVGENQGVAVLIKANHTCVSHRGIGQDSEMQTAKLTGLFFDDTIGTRKEFYSMVNNCLK